MALSCTVIGSTKKCVIYSITGVIFVCLFIFFNFAYLPGRRFTVRKNINSSTSSKVPTIGSTSTFGKPTSIPDHTVEPKLPTSYVTKKKLHPSSLCSHQEWEQFNLHQEIKTSSRCYSPKDSSVCHSDPVDCELPLPSANKSGDRNWPKYGEYSYLPKKLWILVLLHGGVVFLYHPCANTTYVDGLRNLAKRCLRRYVLAQYERLHQPIAMVTWGCTFFSNDLNWTAAQNWIKKNALQGPASHVYWNGDFKDGLVESSNLVTDLKDVQLCPAENVTVKSSVLVINKKKSAHHSSESAGDTSWNNGHVLVILASQDNSTERQKFNSVNAAWALGSVIFLCLILLVVMIYTKPWEKRQYLWRTDIYDSNTNFSLLKSKRYPVKTDRRRKSRWKNSATTQTKPLLGSIPEETDDSDDNT